MKSAPVFGPKHLAIAFAVSLCFLAGNAPGSVTVYQASDSSNNCVPDEPDGTPDRPSRELLGNTITIVGSDEYLTSATIKVGTTDPNIAPQDVTLSLYMNDGASDPGGSGLQQPGTLIDSVTDSQVSLGGTIVPVTFSLPSILVPETFTFVIGFSPGSSGSSLVGAMSDNSGPQIGSAVDTFWYGSGAPGDWTTDSTWAINDGAAVNYIDASFSADQIDPVPEPGELPLVTFGLAAIWVSRRRVRRIRRVWT